MLLHCFDTLGVGEKKDLIAITDHRELMDNCKVSNINQSSEVEKEREYQEWKKKVLENRRAGSSSSSSSSSTSNKNIIKKRKQLLDSNNNNANDENVPNKKKVKQILIKMGNMCCAVEPDVPKKERTKEEGRQCSLYSFNCYK